MKLRRCFSILVILFCGVMLFGCSGEVVEIEAQTAYYIKNLVPDAFEDFKMFDNDHSFLEFGQDFKTMSIIFTTGKTGRVDFVITAFSQKSGNVSGTAARIAASGADGKLITYSFWSNNDSVFIRTLVEYKVYTATETHTTVTIARDTVVAEFVRTSPGYIGGGA